VITMRRTAVFFFITALAAGSGMPEARAAYEDVGVGARVTGMGNAYTAVADDVYSVYYNPAGLGTVDRPMLGTTYSKLFTGLSDNSNLQNSFLAYANPVRNGRQGAYGLAWNYFSLSGLYKEMSFFGSYGRRLFPEALPNGFYAGATVKYLNRSVGSTDAAGNSFTDTGAQIPGDADPVLQKGSKSNYDLDLGLLYRVRPRFTLGFTAQHLLEPDIAFSDSDTDKLGRNVKLGGAYQTPWTTFSGELDLLSAPDGSKDKVGTLAFEKWLPTLLHGTFGIRSSIGAGSREYRQVTAGLSYRIFRLQVDYSFTMPLGTVSDTFGSHRMGLTYRFGRPRGAEPKFSEAILENMRELPEIGTLEFRAQAEDLALYKRTAQREFLRQARVDTGEGRFDEAASKLRQALGLNPKDRKIQASTERMDRVAESFPRLEGFRVDPGPAAVYEGVMDYLAGRDKGSVRKLTYAQSLMPGDGAVESLLQMVERETGLTRAAPVAVEAAPAPTLGKEKQVGADLALMEVALRENDYPRVLALAAKVLELDATNSTAFKRRGTALYAQKKHPEALQALKAAYKHETDGAERDKLRSYVRALESLIEREAAEKAEKRRSARARKTAPTPLDIQKLYEAGVDLYRQDRLKEAAAAFEKILSQDPENRSARVALRRVQAELLRGAQ